MAQILRSNKELTCGLDVVSRSDFSGKSVVGVTLYCGNYCRVECIVQYSTEYGVLTVSLYSNTSVA